MIFADQKYYKYNTSKHHKLYFVLIKYVCIPIRMNNGNDNIKTTSQKTLQVMRKIIRKRNRDVIGFFFFFFKLNLVLPNNCRNLVYSIWTRLSKRHSYNYFKHGGINVIYFGSKLRPCGVINGPSVRILSNCRGFFENF